MSQTATPWPTRDWQTSSVQDHGLNPTIFKTNLKNAESKRHATTSFLVIRHGALIWENYAEGYDQHSKHYVFSVTKSVLSAVVGFAIDQGYISDVTQSVAELIGSDEPAFRDMADVQLHHLLTMNAGYELTNVCRSAKNLNRPIKIARRSDPGTSFVYSDEVAHLVSSIVTAATGKTVLALAEEQIFHPIGITAYHWPSNPLGITHGQAGLEWSSRDMARFGYLYLKNGQWEDKQIIPANWVHTSTRKHSDGGPPVNHPYGYFWWLGQRGGYNAFFAAGFGGQRLFIIPALDLVVVVTSDADKGGSADFYLEEVVLPAIIP